MATHNIVANPQNANRMKMQKVSTSFSNYSDANLEQKAEYIHEQMTTNATFFPAPEPTLGALKDAITEYSTALIAAAGLDRTLVALKNEKRQNLEVVLAKLGMYAMNVALGSVAMLTASGFTLLKQGEVQYITNPGNVVIANGITSGELVASVPAVKGAKSYLHQISTVEPGENTPWQSITTSKAKFTYSELQAGKQYWVRIAAVGSRGQIAYSPVSTQFAQ